jgi:hypothetical protein
MTEEEQGLVEDEPKTPGPGEDPSEGAEEPETPPPPDEVEDDNGEKD